MTATTTTRRSFATKTTYHGFDRHVETAHLIIVIEEEEGSLVPYALDDDTEALGELLRYLNDADLPVRLVSLWTRNTRGLFGWTKYEQEQLDRTTAYARRLQRRTWGRLVRRAFKATYHTLRLNARTTDYEHAFRTIARGLPRPGFRVVTEERAAQAALAAWEWQQGRATSGFTEMTDHQQTLHMNLHLATIDQHFHRQHSKSQRRSADQYRWEADNWLRYEETDPFPQR